MRRLGDILELKDAYRALGEHIVARFLAGNDIASLPGGLDRNLAVGRMNLLYRWTRSRSIESAEHPPLKPMLRVAYSRYRAHGRRAVLPHQFSFFGSTAGFAVCSPSVVPSQIGIWLDGICCRGK